MNDSNLSIAVVVRQFSPHGGLELYAHKLIEGLLERGYNITVICQKIESDLNHEKLKVVSWGAETGRAKWQRLRRQEAQATEALVRHGPFDLVHSQHCPVEGADVVTFHNHTVRRLDQVGKWWEAGLNRIKREVVMAYKMRYEQDERLCRKAKCLIFPASVMKEDFYSVYPFLAQEKVPFVLAHPGASMHRQEPRAPQSAEEQRDFCFLFVGRGYRKKGLDILLAACSRLVKEGRRFKLKIAGMSAKKLDEMRLQVLNLNNTVEYLGFQKDMDSVYSAADVIVLPSRVEPFGMAPVQAMQHGIIPIVSRVSGVAEVLSHQQDALLLDDHLSDAELAQHMARIMDDTGLRAKLSMAARLSTGRLSWQQTLDRTLEAFGVALAAKSESEELSRQKR